MVWLLSSLSHLLSFNLFLSGPKAKKVPSTLSQPNTAAKRNRLKELTRPM